MRAMRVPAASSCEACGSRCARPARRVGFRVAWVRRAVQTCAAFLFAAPLIAAGWALFGGYAGGDEPVAAPSQLAWWGSLSSSQVLGVDLVDPFAALQVCLAAKTAAFWGLAAAVPVLAFYGIVRARAFCGWVCPVNFLLEGTDALRAFSGLRVRQRVVPRHAKLGVACAVLAMSAIASVPVFEPFNPIGALNRALLFGSFSGVGALAAIVAAELFWGRRVWCRSLCPIGGMYQALGVVGAASVLIDSEKCTACGACMNVCLCDSEILKPSIAGESGRVSAGDCMLCGRCVDVCPHDALHIGAAVPKKPRL